MSVATKLQAVYDAISSMKSAITSKGQVLTDVPLSGWADKINAIETGGGEILSILPSPIRAPIYTQSIALNTLKVMWVPSSDPLVDKQYLFIKEAVPDVVPFTTTPIILEAGVSEYTFTGLTNSTNYGISIYTVNAAGGIQTSIFTGNVITKGNYNVFNMTEGIREIELPFELINDTKSYIPIVAPSGDLLLISANSTVKGVWKLDDLTLTWTKINTLFYYAYFATNLFSNVVVNNILYLFPGTLIDNSYLYKYENGVFSKAAYSSESGAIGSYTFPARMDVLNQTEDCAIVSYYGSGTGYRGTCIIKSNGSIKFFLDSVSVSNLAVYPQGRLLMAISGKAINIDTFLSFSAFSGITCTRVLGVIEDYIYLASDTQSPYVFCYDGTSLVPTNFIGGPYVFTQTSYMSFRTTKDGKVYLGYFDTIWGTTNKKLLFYSAFNTFEVVINSGVENYRIYSFPEFEKSLVVPMGQITTPMIFSLGILNDSVLTSYLTLESGVQFTVPGDSTLLKFVTPNGIFLSSCTLIGSYENAGNALLYFDNVSGEFSVYFKRESLNSSFNVPNSIFYEENTGRLFVSSPHNGYLREFNFTTKTFVPLSGPVTSRSISTRYLLGFKNGDFLYWISNNSATGTIVLNLLDNTWVIDSEYIITYFGKSSKYVITSKHVRKVSDGSIISSLLYEPLLGASVGWPRSNLEATTSVDNTKTLSEYLIEVV
jgi:hypothetical protein